MSPKKALAKRETSAGESSLPDGTIVFDEIDARIAVAVKRLERLVEDLAEKSNRDVASVHRSLKEYKRANTAKLDEVTAIVGNVVRSARRRG